MTQGEILILMAGVLFLGLLGAVHLAGLRLIRRVLPDHKNKPNLAVVMTFWELALLHMAEIALCAGALYAVLALPGTGTLGSGEGLGDYLYFAGIAFSTLGYTQIEATGPVRLLVMTISLGGFMVITWSATFIYTIWGESFRQD